MFLHVLSLAQQTLYCMLARHLILVDDVLHDHEAEIEAVILREVDLPALPEEMRSMPDLLADLRAFETAPQRHALYVELVGIALVDQEFHPAEAAFLNDVREALSISEAAAEKFADFADRFHTLAAEGRLLVFESSSTEHSGGGKG